MNKQSNLIDAVESGRLANVSPNAILIAARKNELPPVRFSKRTIRFDPNDVRKWILSKKKQPQQPQTERTTI